MKMKKWLVLCFIAVFALAMVGCGGGDKSNNNNNSDPKPAATKVYQGEGFTIEYPDTVEERTTSVGEKVLSSKDKTFDIAPQVWDGDYATLKAKWSESQKSYSDYKTEDVQVAGKSSVRIYSTGEASGSEILYLIPLNDAKTLALIVTEYNFVSDMAKLESYMPNVEKVIEGLKFQ